MTAWLGLGLLFFAFLVFFVILPFTISLAANDVYATGTLGRYAERLVHVAARAVPADERERRLQDWLADLDTTTSQLLKLWYAFNILIASRAVAAAIRPLTVGARNGAKRELPPFWEPFASQVERTVRLFGWVMAMVSGSGVVGIAFFAMRGRLGDALLAALPLVGLFLFLSWPWLRPARIQPQRRQPEDDDR